MPSERVMIEWAIEQLTSAYTSHMAVGRKVAKELQAYLDRSAMSTYRVKVDMLWELHPELHNQLDEKKSQETK